ncbi:MAG: glutamate--cysteine ligase [Deltaproteobacteria bacterium]|nr:MAG: glutamate--cysteine ligase [Desulfobacterales bacterium]PIE72539.1 MAG: glutamate--cysteine ligase [Deltaproteobacteria bacterium]
MITRLQQQLNILDARGLGSHLTAIRRGIEKEGLRVNGRGQLSMRPHPPGLGAALTNPAITTDYSEALLELITPALCQAEETIEYLENLHRFIFLHLGDELLWAGSMPCRIDDQDLIPIAEFGSSNKGRFKHIYRLGLKHRYGNMMQTIAGIHYNFSLPDSFWKALQELQENSAPFQEFRSASYFTMIRNFRRHSWLLVYLFGASPALSDTFLAGTEHTLERLHKHTLYQPYATSLRMSDLGYSTKAQASLAICFNQLATYISSLKKAIQTTYPPYRKIGVKVDGHYLQLSDTILQIENEYYSDIRPKAVPLPGETALQALEARGVEYIEVRLTDINPFLSSGINNEQALFIDVFLLSCLFMQDEFLRPVECKQVTDNLQRVISQGRKPDLMLTDNGRPSPLQEMGRQLFVQLKETAVFLDQISGEHSHSQAVATQLMKIEDIEETPSAQVLKELKRQDLDYDQWILAQSQKHKQYFSIPPEDKNFIVAMDTLVQDSVSRQQELEAREDCNFEEFLKRQRPRQQS